MRGQVAVASCLFDQSVEIAKMNYTQITQEERYQISVLLKAGHKQNEIAELLERSPPTISRELNRYKGRRGYRPKQANCTAAERRAINAKRIDKETWQFAEEKLSHKWSPEQISGHAKLQLLGHDS